MMLGRLRKEPLPLWFELSMEVRGADGPVPRYQLIAKYKTKKRRARAVKELDRLVDAGLLIEANRLIRQENGTFSGPCLTHPLKELRLAG